MLRWAIRAVAANSYKNKAISESKRASRYANDAKRNFSRAKREKDIDKKLNLFHETKKGREFCSFKSRQR